MNRRSLKPVLKIGCVISLGTLLLSCSGSPSQNHPKGSSISSRSGAEDGIVVHVDGKEIRHVNAGTTVSLSATFAANHARDYDISWKQTAGENVMASDWSSAELTFEVPPIDAVTDLRFTVTMEAGAETGSAAVTVTAYPVTQSLRLEAEDGELTGVKVASSMDGYSGTGYVNGFDPGGDDVGWNIAIAGGYYEVLIGFRSPAGEKIYELRINDLIVSGLFPATDEFEVTTAGLVSVQPGPQTFNIGGGWNHYEVDYIELIPSEPLAKPKPVDPTPVDPEANTEARALLRYLAEQYGEYTLAGQDTRADFDSVERRVGKLPAIMTVDLMDYSPSRVDHGGDPRQLTENTIADSKERGFILSMSWHWNAPMHLLNSEDHPWWKGFYSDASDFSLADALANTDGPEYAAILRDIDAIAVQLRKVEDAGIPILWRPLHESEGAWFWWGASGPEAFIALWRLTYARLTDHHDLHNLIWVLTSEDPAWYPGDDVVDIVGVDAYPSDMNDPLVTRWQGMLEKFDGKKIIALTEVGGVPDIPSMQNLGVWWSYFASWNGDLGPSAASDATLKRVYGFDGVITLDELSD